jgi:hypothetical protein
MPYRLLCCCLVFFLGGIPLAHADSPAPPPLPRQDFQPDLSRFSLDLTNCHQSCQIKSEPLNQGTLQPPLEWPVILLQVFSGAVVASVSSFLTQTLVDAAQLGSATTLTDEERQTGSYIRSAIVLTVVPWPVALTIYGLGRVSNNYYGSYWWALAGSYAGELVAFGLNLLFTSIDQSKDQEISRLVAFLLDGLLTAIGGTLLYTLFRKQYKGIQQIGSLIQFRDKQWTWGIPLPKLVQTREQTIVSVPVLSGRF